MVVVEYLDIPSGPERPDDYYKHFDIKTGRSIGYDNGTYGRDGSQRGRSGSLGTNGDAPERRMEDGEGEGEDDEGSVIDDGIDPYVPNPPLSAARDADDCHDALVS